MGLRNYHICWFDTLSVGNEVQESNTEVVWTRKEASLRIRRKKDSGDCTTWEKATRTTDAEMDGLCHPKHDSYRNNSILN